MSEQTIKMISQELHDGTGQALTTLIVGLRALQSASSVEDVRARAAMLEEVARGATKDLARLLRGLAPIAVDDCGICRAIERHIAEFAAIHSVRVALFMDGLARIEGREALSAAALRIVQEALTNVAKHAVATEVSVVLRTCGERMYIFIEDDGRGFSPASDRAAGWGGRGLAGMRQRVLSLGGTIDVDSAPGEGCTIRVELPLANDHFAFSASAHGFARPVSL
jgi:signal transduction histidine kinase